MATFVSPITVVIVLDHAHVTGGQAKVAFDSALGLKARGHQPIVFAAAGPVDPNLLSAGIPVVCLDQFDLIHHPSTLTAAVQGIWNGEAARALGALLGTLPKDSTVVHVHGWAKALSPAIAAPIRASGLPAVYTLHEYFLLCPNGGFFDYNRQEQCTLTPLSARCWMTSCDARSYTHKMWRATRQVVMTTVQHFPESFGDIICISDFQRDKVGHLLPRGARLHRVDNPIAAEPLGHKAEPAKGEIIFVGRISPEKGPFLFAEAARNLGLKPVFVGDGPLAGDLKTRFADAILLGWQDEAQVRLHLRAASALVFPSVWYEGQPLVVQEARSLGTPVIVSDGCAGREAIVDGMDGLWFRNQDVADLTRALRRFLDADVAAMSRAAYDRYWRKPLSLERHVEAICRIYAERLGRPEDQRSAEPAELVLAD
jgi:glycosyltransferase involved in cell wall biosynthesis